MSPTVLRYKNYRFFFFSREERRIHVHVYSSDGEAKFWLEPKIELAEYTGFNNVQIAEIDKIITNHFNEIKHAWHKYFGSRSN